MRIPFQGYASDCTITGELELDADRLKDHLDRADLLAAQAEEPRGPEQRRIRTTRHRTSATFGPYTVTGDLHDRPGAPTLSGSHSGRPLVSFTDATIAFTRAGRAVALRAETLLVNAHLADWVGADLGERAQAAAFAGAHIEAG